MTIQSSERNEAIIRKVKGLLAIANDNKDDEESQSAFIMAQKLMMKHNISSSEISSGSNESAEVLDGKATVHKKLFWWESQLAGIIGKNFRVKYYINSKVLSGDKKKKRAIIFMGFKQDVELAREMYVLAYDALTSYSKQFVEDWYNDNQDVQRHASFTSNVKNSYIRGFLSGMETKFEEQVKEMEQEYGLILLVPKEVNEKYEEMFKGAKSLSVRIPAVGESQAYQKGYNQGNKIDYTKSTIDS